MQWHGGTAIFVRFSTKQLCRGLVFTAGAGILSLDRRASKAKHHIFLHALHNEFVHIAKLTSVTLVEYQHDVLFLQYLAQLLVLVVDAWLHQVRQFLYRGDDDMTVVVLHLALQYPCRCV